MLGMLSHNQYDRVVYKVAGKSLQSRPFAASRTGLDAGAHVALAGKALKGVLCASVVNKADNPKEGALTVSDACLKAVGRGIDPKSVSITITAPEKLKEAVIKEYIDQAVRAAELNSITVSEINVSRFPVSDIYINVSATGEKIVRKKAAENAELYLVLAGRLGNEGAILLADREHDKLREYYSNYYLKTDLLYEDVTSFKRYIDVSRESLWVEPVLEGGILRSLWQLSEQLHLGFSVELNKFSMYQLAIEISERLDISPYTLRSGGAVILVTDNHEAASAMCAEADVYASVIGTLNKTNGRHIISEDSVRILERPIEDGYLTYTNN